MQKFMLFLGGLVWFGLLFLLTFFVTFPSDAVVERLRWEVADRSNNEYSLELDDIGPWWLGASAQDVRLYQSSRGQDARIALLAKDVRASASPFSLLSRAPYVTGSITPISGTLYYEVGTVRNEKRSGELKVKSLGLTGDAFPLSELMLLAGTEAAGDGNIDISVDVDSEEGMKTASGSILITGSDLTLSEIDIPGAGPLGMDVPIESLNIKVKINKGRADIQKGEVVSSLLKAGIAGSITLKDTFDRSQLDIKIVVSDLGKEFQAFAPMLAQADDGNGKYTFSCTGTVGSPNCGMGDKKAGRTTRRLDRPDRADRPNRGIDRTPSSRDRGADGDDLKKRREERLDRLRKLREERAAQVADREELHEPDDREDFGDDDDDDEILDDEEEFLDEEEGEFFDE